MCVCVCVTESKRETQKERGREREIKEEASSERDLTVGTCDKECDMLRGRNFTFWAASDRIWQSIFIFLILRVFFYILCVSLLKLKSVNLHFLINADIFLASSTLSIILYHTWVF